MPLTQQRLRRYLATVGMVAIALLGIANLTIAIQKIGIKAGNIPQRILLLQAFLAIVTITALVLAIAMSERKRAEEQLRATWERDRLLAEIAQRIRQSLDLEQILNTTVAEVRSFLQVDRVFIGHLNPEGGGRVVAESVAPEWRSLLGIVPDDSLLAEVLSLLQHVEVQAIDDTSNVTTSPTLTKYYQHYQVRASLIIPIPLDHKPFGLIVAHHCSRSYCWQDFEVDFLKQLATQVTIAIQQAQLYQQVQTLNANLEQTVEERTAQLQEKMQELQALYELKDVFLQAVCHDLQTSIMGMLMVMKSVPSQAEGKAFITRSILERMIQSSDRQLTLINALLEDHFDDGRQISLHCQPLSLAQLIHELLEEFHPRIARNQATFTNLVPADLPLTVADPVQLKCVFEHLLSNAMKHNRPGVSLTLSATVEDKKIRCCVEDNGVGISNEQREALFKLYIRSLYTPHLTGIGLGLYLCRQIIAAHGGEIGVSNRPGAGASFWFTLPLAISSCTETHYNQSSLHLLQHPQCLLKTHRLSPSNLPTKSLQRLVV